MHIMCVMIVQRFEPQSKSFEKIRFYYGRRRRRRRRCYCYVLMQAIRLLALMCDPPECEDGQYGVNCYQQCGACLNQAPCDKRTGHCPGKCEGIVLPPMCKRGKQANMVFNVHRNHKAY